MNVQPGLFDSECLQYVMSMHLCAGSSINWTCQLPLISALLAPPSSSSAAAAAGVHEATLAGNGRKLGAAKKGVKDPTKVQSRLCSAAMYDKWRVITDTASRLETACSEQFSSSQGYIESAAEACHFDVGSYRLLKKQTGQKYQACWSALRSSPSVFANWLVKWW